MPTPMTGPLPRDQTQYACCYWLNFGFSRGFHENFGWLETGNRVQTGTNVQTGTQVQTGTKWRSAGI